MLLSSRNFVCSYRQEISYFIIVNKFCTLLSSIKFECSIPSHSNSLVGESHPFHEEPNPSQISCLPRLFLIWPPIAFRRSASSGVQSPYGNFYFHFLLIFFVFTWRTLTALQSGVLRIFLSTFVPNWFYRWFLKYKTCHNKSRFNDLVLVKSETLLSMPRLPKF